MSNKYLFYLLAGCMMFLLACSKPEISYILPPNIFYFQIIQNGEKLKDEVLDSMDFYYYDNNGKKINSKKRIDNEGYGMNRKLFTKSSEINIEGVNLDAEGIRISFDVNAGKGVQNNQWFFEFPNGDIDTLFISTKEVSREEGVFDACNCLHPFSSVVFNAKKSIPHPYIKASSGKHIYVLEK